MSSRSLFLFTYSIAVCQRGTTPHVCQCNKKIEFQSVLTARKLTNAFRPKQLKISSNKGKTVEEGRGTPLRFPLTKMQGYPVLFRYYVFVMGIFATFPNVSTGDTLTCVHVVYIFNSLGPLEYIFRTFLKLSFFFFFWTFLLQLSAKDPLATFSMSTS